MIPVYYDSDKRPIGIWHGELDNKHVMLPVAEELPHSPFEPRQCLLSYRRIPSTRFHREVDRYKIQSFGQEWLRTLLATAGGCGKIDENHIPEIDAIRYSWRGLVPSLDDLEAMFDAPEYEPLDV